VNARIRAGSRFKRFLWFVLIDVRCFRVPPGIRVPQVEDHRSKGPNRVGAFRASSPKDANRSSFRNDLILVRRLSGDV
jgi:hypothetical protein